MKNLLLLYIFLSSIIYASEYKVVFDCSSNNTSYIKSRMWLIGKTIDMIEQQGDIAKVALTLHGSCVVLVANDYELIVPDEDVQNIKQSQEYLIELAKRKNVTITACAMSLAHNAIEKTDILPFVKISKNSFLDTIRYQNNGYALMSFK